MTGVRLIVYEEEMRPREFTFPIGAIQIGRDLSNDLVLSHASVSRRHARIGSSARGDLFVTDDGSTFGTTIDGRVLAAGEMAMVEDGLVVEFGRVRVVCRVDDRSVDPDEAGSDAAFVARSNARLIVLEDDLVRRRPVSSSSVTVGSGAHCTMRSMERYGPLELGVVFAARRMWWIRSRPGAPSVRLGERLTPVERAMPLASNSVLVFGRMQALFLFDYDGEGVPIDDPLSRVPRRTLLRLVASECGLCRRRLTRLVADRQVLGQVLGEVLVMRRIITPLVWGSLAARWAGACGTRSRPLRRSP